MGTIADRIMDDSLSNNDFDFKGIDVYQNYVENGSTQMHSLLTSAVMAWGVDSDVPTGDTVLTLGSTGDIQFIVEGQDGAGKMTLGEDDKLALIGELGAQIKGGDSNNTVQISATTFTFDAASGTNVIDAGDHELFGEITKKNFEFDAKLSEYTGSLQVHGDFITNGHVISRSLNVAKLNDSNVSTGFGFRVTDRDALELYKYDAFNNYTQRIAIFGDGAVFRDDAYSNFPIFGVSNYAPNDQLVLGGGGTPSLWETNGANLFYNNGTVIIGNSETTCNDDTNTNNYDLEVEDTALFKSGIHTGNIGNGVRINESGLENVPRIEFVPYTNIGRDHEQISVNFNGTLSSLYFDDLPNSERINTNNSNLWFIKRPEDIPLARFDIGLPLENGTVNISEKRPTQNTQFTLAHMFHGHNYKELLNSDVENVFNASISNNYGSSYDKLEKGMKTVWFDQTQKEVALSNFMEDSLEQLDKLTIKTSLSVDKITFDKTELDTSNMGFDGTVGSLLEISSFQLTNFVDDITLKSTLSVESLSIGTVGVITPNDSDASVGTEDAPFEKVYFKETNIGEKSSMGTISTDNLSIAGEEKLVVTIDKPLQIKDAAGILLSDGSPLNSLGVEGSDFTSFDYVSLSHYDREVYRIKGDITFKKDRLGTPSTESTKLYIYEVDNTNGLIVPDGEHGTYFLHSYDQSDYKYTLSGGRIIQEQNLSAVDINFTDESGKKRNKLFLSTFKPNSINDIIDLDIYVPETDSFNHKFFVDFNYFHNDFMLQPTERQSSKFLPFNYMSGELCVYNKTKYLTYDRTNDTNKHLIQYISYFDVPIVDDPKSIGSNLDKNFYFAYDKVVADNDKVADANRLDGNYIYFSSADKTWVNAGDFLMYPKITFRNWKNDRNETSFEVVPFPDWDLIDNGVVQPDNIDKEWKRTLLELTFSYIKYGKPGKLNDIDLDKIDKVVNDEKILNKKESYKIVTRSFNSSKSNIYIGVRLSEEIFELTTLGELNIVSPS